MTLVVDNFPIKTDKAEIDYEEFIYILSKKANLNKIYKAEIKMKGLESFSGSEEDKLMELDSVKGLYNMI